MLSYLRFLAKEIKTIPMIKSGIATQSVPKSATLFRFSTANTAAATRKRIPMTRRVLDDKIRPPSRWSNIAQRLNRPRLNSESKPMTNVRLDRAGRYILASPDQSL